MSDIVLNSLLSAFFAQGAIVSQLFVFFSLQNGNAGMLAGSLTGGLVCFFVLAFAVRNILRNATERLG